MRLTIPYCFLASFIVLAACAAPSESVETGDEQNLTERKIFEAEDVVVGKSSGYESEATASLERACEEHVAAQRAIAGARFLDSACGPKENIAQGSGGYFVFAATAKTRFVVEVEGGTSAYRAATGSVVGVSGYEAEAIEKFKIACDAERERAKQLFGARYLGGGCEKPVNLATNGSNFILAAAFKAAALPAVGKTAKLEVALRSKMSGYQVDALVEWRKNCEKWSTEVATAAGANLVTVDCGAPANGALTDGSFSFGSKAVIEVASGSDRDVVASGGVAAIGSSSGHEADAILGWAKSCEATRALAIEVLGADRVLAGSCAEPTNVAAPGNFTLASLSPLATTSTGATKLVVEGFVLAPPSGGASDAYVHFVKASADSVRASVAATGKERVEGFDVAVPQNILPRNDAFAFGAKTKLLVGLDLPEGAIAPIASTSRVTSPPTGYITDAMIGWSKACESAAAKAKQEYGTRFVAAACGEPTITGTSLASDFKVWILP